jgi:hypothetical protein
MKFWHTSLAQIASLSTIACPSQYQIIYSSGYQYPVIQYCRKQTTLKGRNCNQQAKCKALCIERHSSRSSIWKLYTEKKLLWIEKAKMRNQMQMTGVGESSLGIWGTKRANIPFELLPMIFASGILLLHLSGRAWWSWQSQYPSSFSFCSGWFQLCCSSFSWALDSSDWRG